MGLLDGGGRFQRRATAQTTPGAVRGGRPRRQFEIRRDDGTSGQTVGQDRLGARAGDGIDDDDALALGREMAVAPGEEGDENRAEVAAALGQQIFVAGGPFAVAAALEKAEVAVVVLDVSESISVQDLNIIDLVLESGRALVLAFNKWDRLNDDDMENADRRRYLEREIEQDLAHVTWAPRVNISARTGRHMEKLVPALETALESWDQRISTGKFNAFLAELVAEHPHPLRGGKQPRILFGTQASTRPPTFVLFTTGFLDPGYRRFIQRRLREIFGFEGTPIVTNMRVRERRQR
mgnify:CR=1 FL=1